MFQGRHLLLVDFIEILNALSTDWRDRLVDEAVEADFVYSGFVLN